MFFLIFFGKINQNAPQEIEFEYKHDFNSFIFVKAEIFSGWLLYIAPVS